MGGQGSVLGEEALSPTPQPLGTFSRSSQRSPGAGGKSLDEQGGGQPGEDPSTCEEVAYETQTSSDDQDWSPLAPRPIPTAHRGSCVAAPGEDQEVGHTALGSEVPRSSGSGRPLTDVCTSWVLSPLSTSPHPTARAGHGEAPVNGCGKNGGGNENAGRRRSWSVLAAACPQRGRRKRTFA